MCWDGIFLGAITILLCVSLSVGLAVSFLQQFLMPLQSLQDAHTFHGYMGSISLTTLVLFFF